MRSSFDQYFDDSQVFHGSLTEIMGTRFDLVIVGKSRDISGIVWQSMTRELERLDAMLNRFVPSTEISVINKTAATSPVNVSEEMWEILCNCRTYHQKTFGLFDITLKDFSQLELHAEERTVSFQQPNLFLDFGGYAKGYAMKQLKAILEDYKVENCFVDFGNSAIFALGRHPYGDSWKVSIENPFHKGEILGEFMLNNSALSTSGNTPSYTGHIVNPLSGEKIEDRVMLCVESEDPLDAEVLTTALIAADNHQTEKIVSQFDLKQTKKFNL